VPTIGVMIPGVINHDYLGEVFKGVADTAKQHRCSLLTNIQNPSRQDSLTHFLGRGGCDGVVMVIPHNYERLVEVCREYQRECVLVDYPATSGVDDLPSVSVTNREGILSGMRHLLALGHQRIGFITGRMDGAAAQERYEGYRQALEEAGIAYDPALVVDGGWLHVLSYRGTQALLQLDPPPTAIMASCDVSAAAAYQATHERNLTVGKDLSIVGFDDVRMAMTLTPPLTTVRQPMYQLGKTAVEMLLQRLSGQTLPELHVRLETELIIRQSTGAPNP